MRHPALFAGALLFSGPRGGAGYIEDGPGFAGGFAHGNVAKSGDHIRLTFHARFVNYSDGDIVGSIVAPEDSLLTGLSRGERGVVNLADPEEAWLRGGVAIPRRESKTRRQGMMPKVEVADVNASGATIHPPEEPVPSSTPLLGGGAQP